VQPSYISHHFTLFWHATWEISRNWKQCVINLGEGWTNKEMGKWIRKGTGRDLKIWRWAKSERKGKEKEETNRKKLLLCQVIGYTSRPQEHFTARWYESAVLATALSLSVCLSVCLSVTSRCSTKTDKRRIHKQYHTIAQGLFLSQRSPRTSTWVTPYGGTKCRWGGSKSSTFDK